MSKIRHTPLRQLSIGFTVETLYYKILRIGGKHIMRFRTKTKRAIALTAAAVLTATAILPHMYMTPHAVNCSSGKFDQHEWTGLKLYWADIPAATGGNLRWPRKTYFDGGTGIYQGMDNSYCFCVANHTGQAGMGDEGYLEEGAGALLVQDYLH